MNVKWSILGLVLVLLIPPQLGCAAPKTSFNADSMVVQQLVRGRVVIAGDIGDYTFKKGSYVPKLTIAGHNNIIRFEDGAEVAKIELVGDGNEILTTQERSIVIRNFGWNKILQKPKYGTMEPWRSPNISSSVPGVASSRAATGAQSWRSTLTRATQEDGLGSNAALTQTVKDAVVEALDSFRRKAENLDKVASRVDGLSTIRTVSYETSQPAWDTLTSQKEKTASAEGSDQKARQHSKPVSQW